MYIYNIKEKFVYCCYLGRIKGRRKKGAFVIILPDLPHAPHLLPQLFLFLEVSCYRVSQKFGKKMDEHIVQDTEELFWAKMFVEICFPQSFNKDASKGIVCKVLEYPNAPNLKFTYSICLLGLSRKISYIL